MLHNSPQSTSGLNYSLAVFTGTKVLAEGHFSNKLHMIIFLVFVSEGTKNKETMHQGRRRSQIVAPTFRAGKAA